MTDLERLLNRDAMPPVHREWLLAVLGSQSDYAPSHAFHRARGYQDWEWRECDWLDEPPEPTEHIPPQLCKVCNSGRTDAELGALKWEYRKRLGAMRTFAYLRLPVVVAEAASKAKERRRRGYWLGTCRRCASVWWVADDRQERKAEAA